MPCLQAADWQEIYVLPVAGATGGCTQTVQARALSGRSVPAYGAGRGRRAPGTNRPHQCLHRANQKLMPPHSQNLSVSTLKVSAS